MEYGNHHWNKNRNSFIFDEKVTSKSAWLWAGGPATGLFPVLDVAGVPVMWPVIGKIEWFSVFPIFLMTPYFWVIAWILVFLFTFIWVNISLVSWVLCILVKKIPYTYENIFYVWTLLNTSTLGHVIPARLLFGARPKNQAAWQTTCTQIPLGSCS